MSSKIQGLLFNADADNFFASHPDEEMNGEGIDKYVDVLADTGVSNLFIGVSDQRTNYDSKVWQSYWENFDPDGPDDQPRLRMARSDEVDAYRAELTRMVKFHQTGVDYPARMIQRSRQRGVTPWLTIRMNDAHGLESEFAPLISDFARDNPALSRVPYQNHGRADRAADRRQRPDAGCRAGARG